jgi:sugar/nucleoside kinase (ribokinase family)
LEEEKERLRGFPDDQQEGAARDSKHQERAEIVIIRPSAQGASFFHREQSRRKQATSLVHGEKAHVLGESPPLSLV